MAGPEPLERPRTSVWLVLVIAALALLGAIWVIKMVLGLVLWIVTFAVVAIVVWALVTALARNRSNR